MNEVDAASSHALRVLLAIPCHNEEGNIDALLGEVSSLNAGYDTIVIDDASEDGTLLKASQSSATLKLLVNLGIGGAVQAGIKYAHVHGYDYCIQVDGDGQHPPSQISKLIAAQRETRANIVVGSRFLQDDSPEERRSGSFRSTSSRRIGIALIRRSLAGLFGKDISDPTSGFRLFDRKAIQLFAGRYPKDFPEPISLAVAAESGLSICEVSVEMRSREHGISSIRGFKVLAYMFRVVGYLLLLRLSRGWYK